MIEVKKVVRQKGVAKQVTVAAGCLEVTYILNGRRLQEIGRLNRQAQLLDDQALYIPPADYRQLVKTASAILRETRRKVPTR